MENNIQNGYEIENYRNIYNKAQHISLSNFLHSTSAKNIYKHFPHISWRTKFISGYGEEHMDLNVFKDEYLEHIRKHAERNFGFHFDFFEINQELIGAADIKEPESPTKMADLFVSKMLMQIKIELESFIPELTGIQTLENLWIGCQRYRAGHFLKPHTDRGQTDYGWRRIAFSLHMTPDWEADWGGQIMYTKKDDPNPITRVISPTFNTLHIFEVNDDEVHHVVPIAAYTKNSRFGIHGWFHTKNENE